MNKLLASLCIAMLAQTAHAEVMKADFDVKGGWNTPATQVAPVGSLTLTLNDDGSIRAKLDLADNQSWYGVAIDASHGYSQSGMAQGQPSGWGTAFGGFNTGILCDATCHGPLTWTIGNAGEFTSVQQALTGDQSAYDAWLYLPSGEYAGTMAETSAVPEPASIALLGLGLAGVAAARRRKHA